MKAGVVDHLASKATIGEILTFSSVPDLNEIFRRAAKLAALAQNLGFDQVMIGGAGWFMGPLELELTKRGITPLYAFSLRNKAEYTDEDGVVHSVGAFLHIDFVPGCTSFAR